MIGGKGGKKRKGGGLAVPRFGAGRLGTPSPTPSASGSVAGGGVAGAVLRHDAAKVPRLGVAESVADEAVAELVEGVTGMSCDPPVERLFALPVPVATLMDRGEKKARWLEGRVASGSLGLDEALWQMYEWCQENMSGGGERGAACAAERHVALLKVRALSARVRELGGEVAGRDVALLEGGEREAACAAERDEALLEVGAFCERVAGLEVELAVARKEAAAAKDDAGYCRLAGQVHEATSKSAHKLAKKLVSEKRLLQKEVKCLSAGKVLNGSDKGTRMPAPPEPPVCVGSGVQTELAGVSVVGVQTDISRVQVVRERTYASMATQAGTCIVPADRDTVMGGVGVPGPPPANAGVLGKGASRGVSGGGGAPSGGSRPVVETVRAQALLI